MTNESTIGHAAVKSASGIALALLIRAHNEGRDITIPSLGIVIPGKPQPPLPVEIHTTTVPPWDEPRGDA